MSAFYDLSKTPRNILNQAIVRAIVSESNGALFDPSDLSTLYQDAAGTIPVTAVAQPVGLVLDKSGNNWHATQSITASRPTLSARYNLLTKTEDFSDTSAWQANGVNITSNVYKTPFSLELLADKITIPTSSGAPHFVYHQPMLYIAGLTYTYTYNIAYAGYRYVQLTFASSAFGASQYANFDLQSGVVTAQSGGTASIESTANGFFKISFSATATTTSSAGSALAYIDSPTSGRLPLLTGDGLSGYYLFGASLVMGTSAGPYQRVNTATDYDTDERYFPKYLSFDGIDDYLNLPYMGLYANGSASVVAGLQSNIATTEQELLAEKNASVVTQSAFLWSRVASSLLTGAFYRTDAGTTAVNSRSALLESADNVEVYSGVDSGGLYVARVNSVLKNSIPITRGAITLNTTTIGAAVALSATSFFNGKLYGMIITKSALTDSQRVACERYLGRKSGVQL